MGDLRQSGLRQRVLDEVRPDSVVHLAWHATGTPGYETGPEHQHWRLATREFAYECSERGVWFGLAGSGADGARTETERSDYTTAKQELRADVRPLVTDGTCALIRLFYLFSVHDGRPRVLREFQGRDLSRPFVLRDPEATHDFIHIDDAAEGIILALVHGLAGGINVATGTRRGVASLLYAIEPHAEIEPSPTLRQAYPSPPEDQPSQLRALGWIPTRTINLFSSPS